MHLPPHANKIFVILKKGIELEKKRSTRKNFSYSLFLWSFKQNTSRAFKMIVRKFETKYKDMKIENIY